MDYPKATPAPRPSARRSKTNGVKCWRRISKRIGITTNNVAEYKALIAALQQAKKIGGTEVEIRADSELMIRQLNGRYKIKSEGLKPLYLEVVKLLGQFETVSLKHIPRELNTEADKLANNAVK